MNTLARMAGMIVFAFGIILLIAVAAIAYAMFSAPAHELLGLAYEKKAAHTAAGLGNVVAFVLIRIALLFVMASAASLIAARGIQMYVGCASERPARPDADPDNAKTSRETTD